MATSYDCTTLKGRMREICEGTAGISEADRQAYLSKWFNTVPIVKRGKVGTMLTKRIERLLSVKHTKKCGCAKLAVQMDSVGIEGVKDPTFRKTIIDTLVSNRDILIESLSQSDSWVDKVSSKVGNAIPDFILARGAEWLLDEAIKDAELAEPPTVPKTATRVATPLRGVIRERSRTFNGPRTSGPFAPDKGTWRFITLEQYATDIRKLLDKVPNDIDCIAGVARSGLYAATMIAMMLHKPMVIVSQTAGDVVEAGNGWRLGGFKHVTPNMNRVLVVDDTVMTGGSQRRIREVVSQRFKEVIYATVYCNPSANLGKPDIHAVDLPWPHILEWNVFNSIVSTTLAMDFDGILCKDCEAWQDDDGPNYENFINTVQPLYLPRKVPIPLIVTARIEKYRSITEAWLRRQGIQWNRLVMHPASTLRERMRDNIAEYKARHYVEWAVRTPHRPGPIMFAESEHRQAEAIHRISGYPVMCPASATIWH